MRIEDPLSRDPWPYLPNTLLMKCTDMFVHVSGLWDRASADFLEKNVTPLHATAAKDITWSQRSAFGMISAQIVNRSFSRSLFQQELSFHFSWDEVACVNMAVLNRSASGGSIRWWLRPWPEVAVHIIFPFSWILFWETSCATIFPHVKNFVITIFALHGTRSNLFLLPS
jgi:hypothetical protein